jgi:hypothetical protein
MEKITGFPNYEIHLVGSPNGQPGVYSVRYHRYLAQSLVGRPTNCYLAVKIPDSNGDYHTKKIHKLVCDAFLSNTLDLKCVDHINGDRLDNRLSNLRWSNHSSNNHNRKSNKGYTYVEGRGLTNCWKAQIKVNGKNLNLGHFYLECEAEEAYRAASAKYYPGILYETDSDSDDDDSDDGND